MIRFDGDTVIEEIGRARARERLGAVVPVERLRDEVLFFR